MEDISLLLSGSEFARLKASAARGRGVHAYLITGQPGTGKRTFAHLIAAALLCASEAPPCLECGICRRVTEDKHPDVHIFSSSKKALRPMIYARFASMRRKPRTREDAGYL